MLIPVLGSETKGVQVSELEKMLSTMTKWVGETEATKNR